MKVKKPSFWCPDDIEFTCRSISSYSGCGRPKRKKDGADTNSSYSSVRDPQEEWVSKALEELPVALNRLFRYICCFPFGISPNLYTVNEKNGAKDKNNFQEPCATKIAIIEDLGAEIPKNSTIDPIEASVLPVTTVIEPTQVVIKLKTKEKLKRFFKKLKRRQLDNRYTKPNEKCCGECVPIRDTRSLDSNPFESSSNDTLPDVFGDGPQKKQTRRRVTGFFNDIYNFRRSST